jgi:hypothetical protein
MYPFRTNVADLSLTNGFKLSEVTVARFNILGQTLRYQSITKHCWSHQCLVFSINVPKDYL